MKRMTLKQARRRLKLTQEALEKKSGVTQATISLIENGVVTNPTIQTVDKLAAALDLDPGQLTFGVHSEMSA